MKEAACPPSLRSWQHDHQLMQEMALLDLFGICIKTCVRLRRHAGVCMDRRRKKWYHAARRWPKPLETCNPVDTGMGKPRIEICVMVTGTRIFCDNVYRSVPSSDELETASSESALTARSESTARVSPRSPSAEQQRHRLPAPAVPTAGVVRELKQPARCRRCRPGVTP